MGIPRLYDNVCGGYDVGSLASLSAGFEILPSGTVNTKGSWTQIVASTPYDFEMLVLGAQGPASFSWALDIGIGAPGSEIVIVPNFLIGMGGVDGGYRVTFPLHIPAGSAISVRCQSTNNTGKTLEMTLEGYAGNHHGYAGIDAIGFNSASTTGTTVDTAAGVRFTWGSYTQIISSTAQDYQGILLTAESASQGANQSWLYSLAIGAAASEIDIIPNVWMNLDRSASLSFHPFIPIFIPAGTRLSIRQTHEANANTNSPTYVIYGVYG
jgi:hypothetical protein